MGQMTSVGGDGDGDFDWSGVQLNGWSSHCRPFRSRGLCPCPGPGRKLRTLGAWFGWVVGRTRLVEIYWNPCLDLGGACQVLFLWSHCVVQTHHRACGTDQWAGWSSEEHSHSHRPSLAVVRRALVLAQHRRSCMAGVEVQRLVGAGSLLGCRAEEWHSDWAWSLAGEGSSCRWGSSCFLGAGGAEQPEKADTALGRRTPRRDHDGHHHILVFVSLMLGEDQGTIGDELTGPLARLSLLAFSMLGEFVCSIPQTSGTQRRLSELAGAAAVLLAPVPTTTLSVRARGTGVARTTAAAPASAVALAVSIGTVRVVGSAWASGLAVVVLSRDAAFDRIPAVLNQARRVTRRIRVHLRRATAARSGPSSITARGILTFFFCLFLLIEPSSSSSAYTRS